MVVKRLLSEEKIMERIREMGDEISKYYMDKEPVIIGVLKASFIFLADLVRNMKINPEIDFVDISLYHGGKEIKEVYLKREIGIDVYGKDVLIVDTILDTGKTLDFVIGDVKNMGGKSIRVCVLLNKKKEKRIKPDWVGFDIPDVFVVGYGLDYKNRYRNLPYICRIE